MLLMFFFIKKMCFLCLCFMLLCFQYHNKQEMNQKEQNKAKQHNNIKKVLAYLSQPVDPFDFVCAAEAQQQQKNKK